MKAILCAKITSKEKPEGYTLSVKLENLYSLMAQNYANCISDNVRRTFRKKIQDGTILGCAPLGYLNTMGENGRTTVIIDPERGFLVKKLFEEYTAGVFSLLDLQHIAADIGLKTKKGHKLTKNSINAMIKKKFYYGIMTVKGRERAHVYPHLITRELFNKCQDVLEGKRNGTGHGNIDNPFLFRGLVRCKKCGRLFTPELKKGKYCYLRSMPKDDCDCKSVHEEDVLVEVTKTLKTMQITPEYRQAILDTLKNTQESKQAESRQQVSVLQRQYTIVKDSIEELLTILLRRGITQAEYDKRKIQLIEERDDIVARLRNVDTADDSAAETLEVLLDLASNAYGTFERSRIEEKRKLMSLLFSNLEVEDKKIVITIRKLFEIFVNGFSCVLWRE